MFSIESVVRFVLYMLGAGLIFGLLNYLIDYISQNFPVAAPFAKMAKIGLMVFAILILIGVILDYMGHPMVSMR